MDEKWGIIQNKLMVSLIENLEQKATIYVFFLNCEVLDISLVRNLLDKFHNCFWQTKLYQQ